MRLTDSERVGPYQVLGLLGAGGMGQVYLARSPGGRTVAVKVIRPDLAARRGFRERFAREVAAARGVSGMYTAAVIDADPDADLPWMATAYVDGPSLAAVVDAQGPLHPETVLALAAGLAEGLQAIHRAGLVHRDLKPSNVLLAADGPRVIDFGVSWAHQDSRLTDAGLVVGSPGFISPEQALDREVGPASDVFSLGAVLAYAASAQEPFGSGAAQGIMYRLVHEEPDLSAVPAELHHLISVCLAKEAGLRPTTAQLLDRLAESVSEVPLAADPLTVGSAAARLTGAGHSTGSPWPASPGTGMGMAGAPRTGDRLPGGYSTPDARGASGETYRDPDEADARHDSDPWDTALDGPVLGASAPGARAARRKAWPAAAAIGCVLVAAGVAMALVLSPSRPHTGPADPGGSAIPSASSSPGPQGTSSPSANSGQVPGSATRPATTPASARTSQPASSASARSGPSATTAPPASTQPAHTPSAQPSPTTPATSSSPGCFLICIG